MRLLRFLPTRWWSFKAWKTWGSYVHWRLETYGVYYPNGKFNARAFRLMLGQFSGYRRWLEEMDGLRRNEELTLDAASGR